MRNRVSTPTCSAGARRRTVSTLPVVIALAILVTACASSIGENRPVPLVAPPKAPQAAAPVVAAPPAHPVQRLAPVPSHTTNIDALTVRIRVTDGQGTRLVSMSLDEYVLGCVRAELFPKTVQTDAAGRTLQVQAIVSRTYAVANLDRHKAEGFDLCDGTHCQLYRAALPHEHAADFAARAVADTRGQVITFAGRAIQAVFHANCGGHTAAAEHVWTGPGVPYLRPVPDWFCSRSAGAGWEFVADEAQLRQAFNADAKTAIGKRLDRIDITARDAAGRATVVTIAGALTPVVRAEEFRTVMRRAFGPRSLQSTWFSVTRDGPRFRFTGLGYGHGVGLCQAGAALRAQAGQSPTTIVAHYFPGTRIESVTTLAAVMARAVRTVPAH